MINRCYVRKHNEVVPNGEAPTSKMIIFGQFDNSEHLIEYIKQQLDVSEISECYFVYPEMADLSSPSIGIMGKFYKEIPKILFSQEMRKQDVDKIYEYLSLNDSDKQLVAMFIKATKFEIYEVSDVKERLRCVADSFGEAAEKITERNDKKLYDLLEKSTIEVDWDKTWAKIAHRYWYAIDEESNGIFVFFNN